MGKLTVLSALGQPLHAEIELTSVAKDEASTLAPRLASMDAFKQANVEFNPVLFSLRFAVEQRAGRHFIRVTSSQPINEPFVDLLLELGGGNTRLIREYTFLLDPADLRTSQSPQVAAPIVLPPAALARREPEAAAAPVQPVQQPSAQTDGVAATASDNPSGKPEKSVRRAPQPMAPSAPSAPTGDAGEYKVRDGDSLSKIAGQHRQQGVSLDQMLVALYRANPDAFIGKNMNRLRSGQILTLPNAETASAIGASEAHGIVRAHASDFNNYRNKLAGQVAVAAPQPSVESRQSAGGKITAKVEEKATPANEAKDKLKLSKSLAGTGDKAAARADEDRIATEKALAESNARVKELEKNVSELQKLLEIKNKDLADRQRQADAGKVPAQPAASEPAPAVASAPAPAPSTPSEAKPEASAASAAASAPVAASAPPAAKPKIKRVEPEPEPSLVDSLSDYLLPAGLIAALAALGGGFYVWRRRKQEKPFEDSILTDSSLKTNSLFGSTGGQSVDTNNSIFNSSFAPSVSQLDSNEVDPVAEADVYIAYGRDAQAEEILKEALRTQPERHAVRVKLLEIYANRKDLRSFEILATELYGMTKGEGEEWAQAATLGHGIDPKNPLYASGKPAEQAMAAGAVSASPPVDEPDLDALIPSPMPPAADESMAQEAPAEEPKQPSNELDFDLEGLNEQIEAPNTIPRPMPAEIKAEMEEINFDFLDSGSATQQAEQPAAAPAVEEPALELPPVAQVPAPEMPALDMPAIDIPSLDIPAPDAPKVAAEEPFMEPAAMEMPLEAPRIPDDENLVDIVNEQPAAAPSMAAAEQKTEAELEFDLSGITLELQTEEGRSGLVQEAYAVHDTGDAEDYSNNAEMATKLDLAVAYQEIGDKEGARELLDEVIKGGTPEQSEKARTLLAKLA
ncbi:MAG TPA: FimV/HubP family polar landmark protein [Paucimonas sp.]|nr:FimV/HubP family polar landmark protein [Paucimonas sp.]